MNFRFNSNSLPDFFFLLCQYFCVSNLFLFSCRRLSPWWRTACQVGVFWQEFSEELVAAAFQWLRKMVPWFAKMMTIISSHISLMELSMVAISLRSLVKVFMMTICLKTNRWVCLHDQIFCNICVCQAKIMTIMSSLISLMELSMEAISLRSLVKVFMMTI